MKRVLVDLAGQFIDDLTDPNQQQILTLGKDTDSTTLLLIEMMRPFLIVESAVLVRKPSRLDVSPQATTLDNPLRSSMLAARIDQWETTDIERLDLLTLLHLLSTSFFDLVLGEAFPLSA